MAAGQRNQQAGREAGLAGGINFELDEVDRALAVDRQHIIGKPGKVHSDPPDLN